MSCFKRVFCFCTIPVPLTTSKASRPTPRFSTTSSKEFVSCVWNIAEHNSSAVQERTILWFKSLTSQMQNWHNRVGSDEVCVCVCMNFGLRRVYYIWNGSRGMSVLCVYLSNTRWWTLVRLAMLCAFFLRHHT